MHQLRTFSSWTLLSASLAMLIGFAAGACSKTDKPKPKGGETPGNATTLAPEMAPADVPKPDMAPAMARMPGQMATSPAKAGPVSTGPVDECGRYKVDIKLPPRSPCKTNKDCGWTEHRPGSCLDPLCSSHYRAGTLAWVAAANKLHARICEGQKYRSCNKYKCRHHMPTGVMCKDGKCALAPR